MTPDVGVVVNPERTAAADVLLAQLAEQAPDLVVVDHRADRADGLAEAVRAALDDGARVVAAVGGDGTQRTAATALAGTGTPLAVVPGGTVNLLGQVLGIHDVEDSVAAIVGGARRTLDLGTVDDEPFVLNASTGFDARVMHRVDDDAKRLGRLGYALTGWRTLRRDRPRHVEVVVDGRTVHQGRAMTVMVANVGQRASARFTLVPGAEPDDGVLDVLVHRSQGVSGLARAVGSLALGRHPTARDVRTASGTEVEVRWAVPVWAQRDGDALDRRAVTRYRVRPGALEVCVPPGAAPPD